MCPSYMLSVSEGGGDRQTETERDRDCPAPDEDRELETISLYSHTSCAKDPGGF